MSDEEVVEEFFGAETAGTTDESKSGEDVDVSLLSPEDRQALVNKADALRKLLGDKKLAKYKIEVLFEKRKTTRGAFPGAMTVWRSGSVLSGGGDEILYPCPGKCKGYIGAENIAPMSRTAFCTECSNVWKQNDLMELRIFNLTPAKWAFVIAREFIRTGCRADVYMKLSGLDLRKSAVVEQAKERRGESLFEARDSREPVIYSLQDIIKDTNAGASIESRMRALITS